MKWKQNDSGEVVGCGASITVGGTVVAGKATTTFAPNGVPTTRRVLTQTAVTTPGAEIRPDDVPGAYYNGKPDGPEVKGGRGLYMRTPNGWQEFGFHSRDPTTGQLMLICPPRQLPWPSRSRRRMERGKH